MESTAEQAASKPSMHIGPKQFPISQIKIKARVRKDLGDLESLMESIRNHGLLNPIVVNHQDGAYCGASKA